MPYEISWYVEHRVIFIKISGDIDLEEFEQLHADSFAMVENSHHKVHAIADLSEFNAAPTNLRALSAASNPEKNHNQGLTVLVAPKIAGIFTFLFSVILQTLKLEYRISETVEDAVTILKKVDVDLRALDIHDPQQS